MSKSEITVERIREIEKIAKMKNAKKIYEELSKKKISSEDKLEIMNEISSILLDIIYKQQAMIETYDKVLNEMIYDNVSNKIQYTIEALFKTYNDEVKIPTNKAFDDIYELLNKLK